jgi:hypothetical protein
LDVVFQRVGTFCETLPVALSRLPAMPDVSEPNVIETERSSDTWNFFSQNLLSVANFFLFLQFFAN